MLIECAEFVILKWRGVERDDAWDLAEPALGEDGGHLCVEEQGVESVWLFMRATSRRARKPARTVQLLRYTGILPQFPWLQSRSVPNAGVLRVEGDVGEEVLGVRDVSERLLQ